MDVLSYGIFTSLSINLLVMHIQNVAIFKFWKDRNGNGGGEIKCGSPIERLNNVRPHNNEVTIFRLAHVDPCFLDPLSICLFVSGSGFYSPCSTRFFLF